MTRGEWIESEQRGKKKLNRRGDRPGVTQKSLSAASTHQMYSQLSREERSSGFSCNKNGTRLTLTILAAKEIPALCSPHLRHNTHNLKLTGKGFSLGYCKRESTITQKF